MRKVLAFCAFICLIMTAQAQDRYGHLNFGNLVSMMPASAEANTALEQLQQKLVADGEAQAQAFQTKYLAFAKSAQEGNLTTKQISEQQAALEAEQQQIVALEQQIAQQIELKRQELLGPIIESAQQAVEEVAKENNFVLVFDTSIFGAVLFAEETEDLMPLVKAKMGIE